MKTLYEISADFERIVDMYYDDSISDQDVANEIGQLRRSYIERINDQIAILQQMKDIVYDMDAETMLLLKHRQEILCM